MPVSFGRVGRSIRGNTDNLKALLVAASLAAPTLSATSGFAADDVQWKAANGPSCDQVCDAAGLTAI